MKKKVAVVLTLVLLIMAFNPAAMAASNDAAPIDALSMDNNAVVTAVIKAINDGDVTYYISLFDSANQKDMNEYVKANGADLFFQEKEIKLIDIKALSYSTGIAAASVTSDELKHYGNIIVYYTKEQVTAKPIADRVEDGVQYRAYVLGTENGKVKVLRISQPNINIITNAGESFNNDSTKAKYSNEQSKNVLYLPSTICVYFTKLANRTYHGSTRANIDFNTYQRNVIPNEWIVSYYASTPAYLEAGAMASKMYAWYHVIVPKWNYSPYYADVKDNSSDQNYLATAYSSLASTYQSYINSAMSTISITAMVDSAGGAEDGIFEVHYHATNGTQYSGTMSASGARSLAQQGYTYQNILRYYYDYCPNAGGNPVFFRVHF